MATGETNGMGPIVDLGQTNHTNYTREDRTDKRTTNKWFLASVITAWTLALLLIILNTAVIVCIARCKKRSRLNCILLHMAIADLLLGLTDAVIHSIERTIGFMEYGVNLETFDLILIQNSVLCALQRGFSNACQLASNFILCAASFDRALVVAKPMLNFRRGYLLQKCMIGLCWILAFAGSIPIFQNFRTQNINGSEDMFLCTIDDELYKMIFYYLFVVMFLVPFIFIVVCYIILITAVYRRGTIQNTNKNGRKLSTAFQVFNNGLPRSKVRSIKLMCGIVTSFVLSWLPFYIFAIANIHEFKHISMVLLTMLYYCNGVANPIVFFLFHRSRDNSSSRTTTRTSPLTFSLMQNNCGNVSQHNSLMVRNLST